MIYTFVSTNDYPDVDPSIVAVSGETLPDDVIQKLWGNFLSDVWYSRVEDFYSDCTRDSVFPDMTTNFIEYAHKQGITFTRVEMKVIYDW